MSSPPTHQLLVRDRQNLDRVAKHLKRDDHAFFCVVCAPSLVHLTIEYLRDKSGKDVPLPVHVAKQDAMLALLGQLEAAPASAVFSVHLAAADVDAWTALNWNREKLLRGGRLLLFVDSIDDVAAFHQHAPDAYSFRESVFAIEGAPAGAPDANADQGEPFDVRTARMLYELKKRPEERAEAAFRWVKALYERRRIEEAAKVAEEALALIPRKNFHELSHRRMRIVLYDVLEMVQYATGQTVDCFRTCQRGLRDIGVDLVKTMTSLKLNFELHASESPLGVDRDIRRWSIKELPGKTIQNNVRRTLASSESARGQFRAAHGRYDEVLSADNPITVRAEVYSSRARMHSARGHFRRAHQELREADMCALRAGANRKFGRFTETRLLVAEGELDAARSLAASHDDGPRHLATITAQSGDISSALDHFDTALTQHVDKQQDSDVFWTCVNLHSCLAKVPALSRKDLDRAFALVESAAQKLIDLANHHPVWYDVLVPGLRAQMLSLYDDRHDDAVAAAKRAVFQARSSWPQALARSLRIHGDCLARAGRWKEMGAVLLDGMKAARDDDDLIELATLQAYDLALFVRKKASQNFIDTARRVLEETFAEMDAPRVEGETWLGIAPYLPLEGGPLDVLAIAEHIHDLFTEMPMPEQASRAMEWLGDAHAARGDTKKAEGAYRMALAPLVRHGFGLRTDLIREKLGRVVNA